LSGTDPDGDRRRVVEAVWRIESARLIAALARLTGDLGSAEELAQDALVAALEQWPRTGTPPNPGGWLMTTARRRAIDRYRRDRVHDRALASLGREVSDGHDPFTAEVHGLLALMELQAARFPARTGPDGGPVLLADQDRRRWDRLLIRRGLAGVARAESASRDGGRPIGPYTVQAAIASCHARAGRAEDTDWATVAQLYAVLARLWPSPVVELNRAVAVGMAEGPEQGLAIVAAVAGHPRLAGYPRLPAVRGELLAVRGDLGPARDQFLAAAELTRSERERQAYLRRAAALEAPSHPPQ
jgi:predicted RNA polymerase sigma factor